MQSYYSLLYAQLNVATRERIVVGLVMVSVTNKVVIADYSRRKLRFVKELSGIHISRNLKWALEAIVKKGKEIEQRTGELFREDRLADSMFSHKYLKYLSNYSSNLLIVDPPRKTDLPVNESNFEVLYLDSVDDQGRYHHRPETHYRRFTELKSRESIRKHFKKDVKIDQFLYDGIKFPVNVDLAGQNGRLTVAKLVATDRPVRYINDDAHAFQSLLSQTPEAKHFIVSSEPNKITTPKKHFLWCNLRDVFKDQYLDLSEISKLESYAKEYNVRPIDYTEEE